jgi:anti-sigma regulatory factor (Ser/Thr protein kinase)
LGDATLSIKRTLEKFFEDDDCFKNTVFHSSRDFLRRLGICSYEAESNIIIHASSGLIKVILCCDKIRVSAVDEGPGIKSVIKAFIPGFSTASETARQHGFGAGIGLNNIQKLADFFIILSGVKKRTLLLFEVWRDCKKTDNEQRRIAMKAKEIIKSLNLEILTRNIDMEKEVKDAYACDLLSNVLSKAEEEHAWLTMQSHVNIVGVASIKRIPLIIVTEGSTVPIETIKKAEENRIIIVRAKEDTFTVSGKLYNLFRKEWCND